MATLYQQAFPELAIADDNSLVIVLAHQNERLMLLNGGPVYHPNPAISLMVMCETEAEVEKACELLLQGGKALMELDSYPWSKKYAWVEDRFGISWQLYFDEQKQTPQKFSPTLMFTQHNKGKAHEAIGFYTSVFPESRVQGILKYEKDAGEMSGLVQHAQFEVGDFVMMAMDGGMEHNFVFDKGVSLVHECSNQEEIDRYWNMLTADGGQEGQCGWLKDKYGVSWQIVPEQLGEWLRNPETREKVVQAFMPMKKPDLATLEAAAQS